MTELAPTGHAPTVLRIQRRGPVRTLVLQRPARRNALDAPLVDALTAALTDAEHDPATRAVLVTGAGPSFCAGADLQHLLALADAGASPVPFLRTVSDLTRRIERSPLPVVAALHGHAVAGGLEIALACDAVVAETGTLIGDGHIRNHLVPGAGSAVRMRRKLGDSLGRWLGLSGELLPAERFLPTGWLHAVVDTGRGAEEGLRVAEALAAAAGPAQAAFKAVLAELDDEPSVEAGLRVELEEFARHWATHDVPAELRRFLTRRAAG
ncbi:enoyl-CoA hydratase/isomerase family protein [Pseudonocardia broussonetiae]|uniref:enoyl-CoA hydratase/isomerase family protein n=1 Tax=Pseudonocardia broussonetiae TaxID=2736640 RepID=UPI001962F8F2|nr:enoyl-CoA hydratase/isomerase family protein [Pseudonocardia broussonetiae]